MPRTYDPIASQTVSGSTTSTVTFNDIPGTYTDLVLVINSTDSVEGNGRFLRFNGDTASNYSRTFVYGTGSAVASGRSSDTGIVLPTSTTRYVDTFHIMSYASTSVFKTTLNAFAMPSYLVGRLVGLWRSTSAITSVTVTSGGVTFSSGSTFSLYGIKAA